MVKRAYDFPSCGRSQNSKAKEAWIVVTSSLFTWHVTLSSDQGMTDDVDGIRPVRSQF